MASHEHMELIVPLLLPPFLEKISASILDCHINPDILSLSTISKNSFTLDFNPDIPSSPLNWGGGVILVLILQLRHQLLL